MKSTPDVKLLAAMEDIKDVLKRYDIAGSIILQSPMAAEHLFYPYASWACTEPVVGGIRIKSLLKNYPDVKAQKREVEITTAMLVCFGDISREHAGYSDKITKMIGGYFDFDYVSKKVR